MDEPYSYESSGCAFYGIPSSVEVNCITGNPGDWNSETGEWESWSYTEWTTGSSSFLYKTTATNIFLDPVFWTNTDIYDLDGNLWLAASDPTPVYE